MGFSLDVFKLLWTTTTYLSEWKKKSPILRSKVGKRWEIMDMNNPKIKEEKKWRQENKRQAPLI